MTKNQNTFAKRQRERMKKEKAQMKRERRQIRKQSESNLVNDPDEVSEINEPTQSDIDGRIADENEND